MITCETNNYIYIILTIAGMILEYWLGRMAKADGTKSGSIVELLINILSRVLKIKRSK